MTNNNQASRFSKAIIATLTILFVTGNGAAATVTVGSGSQDNATIGAAIDYASPGDTIEVEDGTYEVTDRINVDKSVTIKSAGSYRPVINNTDDGWAALKVTADDVTLESLKFVNLNNSGAERVRGIHGNRDSDGLTIKDVVVDGVDGTVSSSRPTGYGMTLLGNSTRVVNSEVKNVEGSAFAAGIRLGGNSTLKVEGGTIDNVDVSGIEERGSGTDSVGIFLASIASGKQTVVKDTQVSGLTATNGSAGIYLVSQNPDAVTPDVSIKSNDLNVSGGSQGSSGIYVEDSAFTDLSQVVVSDNDFSGSDAGAANADTDDTLDASGNYWGSAAGPQDSSNTYNEGSQGVEVGDNVDFTPWLDAAGGSNFAPVENTDTGTGYPSIQAAVDAASPGDTIGVKDGTYSESVSVKTANLTIRSVEGSTPVVSYHGSGRSDGTDTVKIASEGVTFSGFEVWRKVSDSRRNGSSYAQGVTLRANDTVAQNLEIRGGFDKGHNHTQGITAIENSNDVENVTIEKVNVSGFSMGIAVSDYFSGDLSDVDIINSSARNNFNAGLIFKSHEDTSATENVDVTGSRFVDNQIGILVTGDDKLNTLSGLTSFDASEASVTDSVIKSNSMSGIHNGGTNTLKAEYNYYGQHSGPDSQVSGDVDYRPWLLTADGKHYDETIRLDGGSWSLFSVPKEADMSKSALKVDDGGSATQMVYDTQDERFETLSGASEANPLGAAFVHSENDAGVGLVYTGSSDVSRTVYEGWNLISSTKEIKVQDALSPIGNSLNSFYAPGAYNSEKVDGHNSFGSMSDQVLDATSLSDLQSRLGSNQKVSPYDGYWVKASGQATLDMSVPQPN